MSKNVNLNSVLAEHLYENYISKLEETQKLVINEIDYEFSKELAYLCNIEHSPKLIVDCNIVVLSKEVREKTFEVSPQKAVEFRNQKTPMLIFVPTEFNELSSLQGLKTLHTVDIINGLIADYVQKNATIGIPILSASIRRGITKLVGPDQLLSFLIDTFNCENPKEYFASNLSKVGLIADDPSNVIKDGEIERNLQFATQLSRKNFPLVDSGELVNRLGLAEGEVKLRLKEALDSETEYGEAWSTNFNPDLRNLLLFANWPLNTMSSVNLVDLRFKSFLSADGGVTKKSKLGIHPKNREFLCTGKVVLEWTSEPVKLQEGIKWKLEILNSLNLEVAESIFEAELKGSTKSRAVDLSDELEDIQDQQRVVARLSAIDDSGAIITKTDGELAQVLSEDFLLIKEMESDVEGGDQKSTNVNSIASALIYSLLNDKNVKSVPIEGASRLQPGSQTFEFEMGSRLARMRVSNFVRAVQTISISNSNKALSFTQKVSLGASVQDAESLLISEIECSPAFLNARARYFQFLQNNGETSFPESMFWSKEACEILEEYLVAFSNELSISDDSRKREILALDTVTVTVETSDGPLVGTILLPIHPMRSKWISMHFQYAFSLASALLEVKFETRRNSIDLDLFSKLDATNLPFALETQNENRIYAAEFLYGSAIYLAPDVEDVANQIATISRALGVTREINKSFEASKKIAEHLFRYRESNKALPGLKIAVVNPGDGSLMAEGLSRYEKLQEDEDLPIQKVDVSCFANNYSFADPVGALVDLQKKKLSYSISKDVLFNSDFGLRALTFEDFDRKPEFNNVSIMQSATQLKAQLDKVALTPRKALLGGLITYLHSDTLDTPEGVVFKTSVSTGSEAESASLAGIHRKMLGVLSESEIPFQMSIVMNRDMSDLVNEIHRRSDWVLTIDRFIGLNLYEEMLSKNNPNIVVLDYSPDFVDGFGERITLTTTKNNEVSRVIARAMRDLGLADEGMSSLDVLRDLAKISGRLAMRLLSQNSLATEAVGLCATVKHLRDNEKLVSTIIIPVDAHPELFGLNRHDPDSTSKRCDLMLVKFDAESYSVQLIEVKTRKAADIDDLQPVIKNQLENTEALLKKVIFQSPETRVDADLQWARWSSLLHFYLDRSRLHGNFENQEEVAQLHTRIEQLCEDRLPPTISKAGYIVSLNADSHNIYDENDAYQLHVLNEEMLASSGWTTLKENEFRNVEDTGTFVEDEVAGIQAVEVASVLEAVPDIKEVIAMPTGESGEVIEMVQETDSRQTAPKSLNDIRICLGESATVPEFNWLISLKGSPHAVVVGIPGQGKSVTTRNILNQFAEYGLPSIVFDFHGEMGERVSYNANVIKVADNGLPFSPFEFDSGAALPIKSSAQEISEILAAIGGLGEIQRSNVHLALRDCYFTLGWTDDGQIGERLPNIRDFEAALKAIETQNKGKNAIARLQSFTDFGLFNSEISSKFEVLNPRGYIFDVSKYRQDEVKITAGAFILRRIYNDMFQWGNADHPKLAIVLDEAHRLAKDPTIPKLMKEGRKYGIVILLVSQSLDDFAPQVIENAGTKIAFRTNYPASRKVSSLLQNKNSKELADRLEVLTTGKAIVSTPENPKPVQVKMKNAD